MSADNESPPDLTIRCPSCRQRFNVADNLMNRMVECGGCSSRFRINDDVIIRSKKFYPGERKKADLSRFSRVPLATPSSVVNIETVSYQVFKHPEQLVPASPQRVIAGAFGVLLILVTALIFLFATGPSDLLSAISRDKKLIVAGFASFIGIVLLIYANPRARIKATFIAILLSAGLFSIPLFLKSELPKKLADPTTTDPNTEPVPQEEVKDPLNALGLRFGTTPLENERQRLAAENYVGTAYGVYITNMSGRHKYIARDFLIREIGADLSSHLFPRDGNNYLMVLNNVTKPLDDVAKIAGKMGRIDDIHPEIGVVVVTVNNDLFKTVSLEQLSDKTSPAFYDLNLRELVCIDVDRIEHAVERLMDAEPSVFRADITSIMIDLLNKPGVKFHGSLSRALIKWAEDPKPAAVAGLTALQTSYISQNITPPDSLVTLVVNGGMKEAIPVIGSLWVKNPVIYENYLLCFGQDAELFTTEHLRANEPSLRYSAIKILGNIGTADSLPLLRELLDDTDTEIRVLAQRAIQQIEAR